MSVCLSLVGVLSKLKTDRPAFGMEVFLTCHAMLTDEGSDGYL